MEHFDNEKRKIRNPHDNIKDIVAHIAKLEEKKERLLDIYEDGKLSKEDWDKRTDQINSQISEADRHLQRLSETSEADDDIERRRNALLSLFEIGYRYKLGLTDDVPFYVDEHGNEHGTDQENEGWKETGAPTRNRVYKDIGLKVQVSRDDVWVELGGSAYCPHENFS